MAKKPSRETDERYWAAYTEIQAMKHALLQRYLQAWFPILQSFNGRICYFETHAGRGRHKTGEPGSPLVALDTLLEHRLRERILETCEVLFIFCEIVPENAAALRAELEGRDLPDQVRWEVVDDDFEGRLRDMVDNFQQPGKTLAPSFFFIDPYGFNIPMDLLQSLLALGRSELFINFMEHFVNRWIFNPKRTESLNRLFGSEDWKQLCDVAKASRRDAMIRMFVAGLECEHYSEVALRDKDNIPRYSLLHATNHPRGRQIMKDAIWSVNGPEVWPGGRLVYSVKEREQDLFGDLDVQPLEEQVLAWLQDGPVYYNDLEERILNLLWLPKHLKSVLRAMRKDGRVVADGYRDRFAFNRNPRFFLPDDE